MEESISVKTPLENENVIMTTQSFENNNTNSTLRRRRNNAEDISNETLHENAMISDNKESKKRTFHLFGLKPWKGNLFAKSETGKQFHWNITDPNKAVNTSKSWFISFGNVFYSILIGWWMFLIYCIVGLLCFMFIITIPYGKKCFQLAFYYFYPFGKYLERLHEGEFIRRNSSLIFSHFKEESVNEREQEEEERVYLNNNQEEEIGGRNTNNNNNNRYSANYSDNFSVPSTPLEPPLTPQYYNTFVLPNNDENVTISEERITKKWSHFRMFSAIVFSIFLAPILLVFHLISSLICWLSIVGIPSSKVHFKGLKLLYSDIITIDVSNQFPPRVGADILLCTYQASNINYYNYSVFGLNVILVNMLPFSIISIILGYSFGHDFVQKYALGIFPFCMLSTIPLAYLIGKAIAAISVQTNYVIGALLNATFGSIIELILYFLALWKGLHDVVVTSVTGAILATTLFVPGLAMIFGGIKYKQQFFNRNASVVSSALLLLAVVGCFLPTLFYVFNSTNYELSCGQCVNVAFNYTNSTNNYHFPSHIVTSVNGTPVNGTYSLVCEGCTYVEKDPLEDPIYLNKARPFAYATAAILPLAYIIGLIFSLKTHKHLIEREPTVENKEDEEELLKQQHAEGEEMEPEWPIYICVFVLLLSTIVYAFVAEVITSTLDSAFEMIHLNPNFAGLTLLSIIPSIAEFLNAIQFAVQNNITLALEIGNTAAIQISLIQIPILVVFSSIIFPNDPSRVFLLNFPTMHLVAIFFAVTILNYICLEGKSNYFQGSTLVIVYLLIVLCFFFTYL
ncbi:hypothetical protein ABK040_007507 [Willaertia magna]